jgi:hypothetical protein
MDLKIVILLNLVFSYIFFITFGKNINKTKKKIKLKVKKIKTDLIVFFTENKEQHFFCGHHRVLEPH